jgi:hypothetical protein
MGYTSNFAKTRINVANNCWGLLTAVCAAILVGRFPRRIMFMTSAGTMFLMFLGFTVSMDKLAEASNAKRPVPNQQHTPPCFSTLPSLLATTLETTQLPIVRSFPYHLTSTPC